MYTGLFLLSEIVYSYLVYKILGGLSGRCRQGKTVEILCYLGYGLVTGEVYLLWNIPILTVMTNMILLFLISMMYENRMSGRFFHVILIYILLGAGETIAMLVMREMPREIVTQNIEYGSVFTVYLSRLIQLVISELTIKILGRKQHEFTGLQTGIFFMVSIGSVYLEMTLYQEMFGKNPLFVVVTCVIILILDVCIIWSYDILSQQYQKAKKSEILSLENKAYQNEIELMKNQEASTRRMRHDIKNHCIALEELVKREDKEKALRYLQDMVQDIGTKQVWLQTGNPVIDGFVNYKFAQAEEQKIHCYAEAKIPGDLPLDEYAYAGILGNLLDNAIEAAVNTKEPEICLRLIYDKNVLHMQMSNTYQGEIKKQGGMLISGKKDKENHGYGMSSVKRSVERCHGQFNIEYTGGRFMVFLMMPMTRNEDK